MFDPVVISPVKPAELHQHWAFLRRGLDDIVRRVKPDWISEDIFGAIRADVVTAIIVSRGTHKLGFAVYHRQNRPWSGKYDLFLWAAWAIPLRERLPDDDLPQAIQHGIAYLHDVRRSIGAERLVAISSRRGLCKKYGLKTLFYTLEI